MHLFRVQPAWLFHRERDASVEQVLRLAEHLIVSSQGKHEVGDGFFAEIGVGVRPAAAELLAQPTGDRRVGVAYADDLHVVELQQRWQKQVQVPVRRTDDGNASQKASWDSAPSISRGCWKNYVRPSG